MFSCEHADKSNIGPTGPGTVSGTVPQLAYFSGTEGDASDVLVGTPNAIAGAGNTTTGVTNQILFSDGSNVAPVLSFQDDKNTGLYRIGTDNIGIATNSIKAVDIAVTETEVTGTNSVTGINDVLKVNQEIPVKLLEVDRMGRLNLSYIDALVQLGRDTE